MNLLKEDEYYSANFYDVHAYANIPRAPENIPEGSTNCPIAVISQKCK